jgi:hypothetical protein
VELSIPLNVAKTSLSGGIGMVVVLGKTVRVLFGFANHSGAIALWSGSGRTLLCGGDG